MLLEKVGRLELEIWKSTPGFEPTGVDVDDRSDGKNSAILRTCLEIRETDPSLDSGMYWIDPDGQGVGDGAIYVFCDMTLGKSTTKRWPKYKYLKIDVTVGTQDRHLFHTTANHRQMWDIAPILDVIPGQSTTMHPLDK
jgi:hypothetical protein